MWSFVAALHTKFLCVLISVCLLHDGSVRLDFMTDDPNEAEEMLWRNICGLLSSSLSP